MNTFDIRQTVGASVLAIAAVFATSATAETFSFDFDSGLPAGFSGAGSTTAVLGLSGINGFDGDMLVSSTDAILSLSGLAAHGTVSVSFGFAAINSWDGPDGGYSPDYFNMEADGVEQFQISADNTGGLPDVPSTATDESLGEYYGGGYRESVYTVSLSFAHSGSSLTLDFFADGAGWQGGADEFWAIDNLVVTTDATPAVPLPAGLPLLAGGMAALGLLRRPRT